MISAKYQNQHRPRLIQILVLDLSVKVPAESNCVKQPINILHHRLHSTAKVGRMHSWNSFINFVTRDFNEEIDCEIIGSWMYIVNQVDTTRQLVRTETCAYVLHAFSFNFLLHTTSEFLFIFFFHLNHEYSSSVCSNLCQLPNGYSSRCEQKYVQKRLIALNADGTNLYTDTFWFPSCCACTIAGPT